MKHLAYIFMSFVILFNVQLVKAQGDVKIGTQVWTSKNLDVSTFRNGEAIPEAKSAEEWEKASNNQTAAFCYYDYDSNNGKVYGKLYNWYAVNDPRGLAPNGWHIPSDGKSDAEWIILLEHLGGEEVANEKMKSKQGWKKNEDKSGNGNDNSGFNGLPGGYCDAYGSFHYVTEEGYFWSSSEDNADYAWSRYLYYKKVIRNNRNKNSGLSVRCIRD